MTTLQSFPYAELKIMYVIFGSYINNLKWKNGKTFLFQVIFKGPCIALHSFGDGLY